MDVGVVRDKVAKRASMCWCMSNCWLKRPGAKVCSWECGLFLSGRGGPYAAHKSSPNRGYE